MVRVGIVGASGYTSSELIRLLVKHPDDIRISVITSESYTGQHVTQVMPNLRSLLDLKFESLDIALLKGRVDFVFLAVPHKVAMSFAPRILELVLRVIDFSADYRLKDAQVYEAWYKTEHTNTELLPEAVYGLPELFREEIKGKQLVANPGCYPTGALLATAPLLKEGLIETDSIIDNAVTGSSGAGMKPSSKFHFPNMNENLFPYGIGTHRHMPEIEQITSDVAGKKVTVLFQPHVGPFDRGILSTVYCQPKTKLSGEGLSKLYNDFYQGEPFVQVRKDAPAVKDVAGTNYCHIFVTCVKSKIVCFSAIDNLVKGASGQAIQNMNIIFGLEETLGLK